MLKQGKAHWLIIAGVLAVFLLVFTIFLPSDDPTTKAQKFMTALGDGDSKKLAEYTTSGTYDQNQLETLWAKTVKDSEFHRFRFKILGTQVANSNQAQVRMHVQHGPDRQALEENFALDLQKVDGVWKVRLEGISRTLYPFLPR